MAGIRAENEVIVAWPKAQDMIRATTRYLQSGASRNAAGQFARAQRYGAMPCVARRFCALKAGAATTPQGSANTPL
jgi:hypothetical protein